MASPRSAQRGAIRLWWHAGDLVTDYGPIPRPRRLELSLERLNALSGTELAQAVQMLREWEELHKANPLLGYEPAGRKHHEVHMTRSRLRAIFGGNRAGKTTTATLDSLLCMTPKELVPPHLTRYRHAECPFYLRVVVPDMKRTGEVVRQAYRDWTPKALLKNGSFERSYDKNNDILRLECGCFVELLSTEMDLNKFGGSSRHRVHYDEEPPALYRTESAFRLIDTAGDELFSLTPLNGLTYLYHDVWKKRDEPGVDAWAIGIRDNRTLTTDAIEYALSLITNDAERAQREFGVFAERGGQVYAQFLTRKRPAPSQAELEHCDILVGIDPGARFTGLIWVAFNRHGRALAFAAAKLENSDVKRTASVIKKINSAWGIEDSTYVIDPAAVNRNLDTGRSYESALVEEGISCVHGQNAVEPGISHVQMMLRLGFFTYSEQLGKLEDEAVEYAWEEREDGKAVPVKKNDHILDALRYVLMHRPWMPDPGELWLPPGAERATGPPRKQGRDSIMGAMI